MPDGIIPQDKDKNNPGPSPPLQAGPESAISSSSTSSTLQTSSVASPPSSRPVQPQVVPSASSAVTRQDDAAGSGHQYQGNYSRSKRPRTHHDAPVPPGVPITVGGESNSSGSASLNPQRNTPTTGQSISAAAGTSLKQTERPFFSGKFH